MNTTPKSNYTEGSNKDIPKSKCHYGMTTVPEYRITDDDPRLDLLPLSRQELPAIGARVKINFNKLGTGTVVAYFTEHGFIGVEVALEDQPCWHRKQNGANCNTLVFGKEFTVI